MAATPLGGSPGRALQRAVGRTWYERLRARGLDYLLVDDRYISEQPPVVGFSRPTLANLDALVQDGRVQSVARAGPLRPFQVR